MQYYRIPVEWAVYDSVVVEAESLEDAVKWVQDNIETIPLGTTPEYIDGSYKISTEEQNDVNKMAKEIRDFYGEE